MKRRFAEMVLAVVMAGTVPALADGPKPFPEFTFKRVAPPKADTIRRIMVQIEPQPEPPADDPQQSAAPDGPALAYDWYWAAVSPEISDSGPGRLEQAVLQLTKGPGVPAPRLQALKEIAERHGTQILAATIGTRVSPALVLAVIGIESSGRTDAVSGAGATGLMQLMPDTATRFGVTDISDPVQNIKGGVAYLDWLMGEFDSDPILVLAGYNAGENAVKKNAGVPPYAETRAYVPKVLSAWTVARGLCMTPPQLITDGCAFAVQGTRSNG